MGAMWLLAYDPRAAHSCTQAGRPGTADGTVPARLPRPLSHDASPPPLPGAAPKALVGPASLAAIVAYIIFFALGAGPIPWL